MIKPQELKHSLIFIVECLDEQKIVKKIASFYWQINDTFSCGSHPSVQSKSTANPLQTWPHSLSPSYWTHLFSVSPYLQPHIYTCSFTTYHWELFTFQLLFKNLKCLTKKNRYLSLPVFFFNAVRIINKFSRNVF